jgi:hypothetical protein
LGEHRVDAPTGRSCATKLRATIMFDMRSLVAMSLVATGVMACGADSDPRYDRIATGLSAMTADPNGGDARTFHDSVLAARGTFATGLTLGSGGVVAGARGDLTLKYELACKDLQDAALSTCDGAASADVKAEWKGKVESTHYKLELDRHAEWTVRDFDGVTATIHGHSSYRIQSDFKDTEADLRHKYHFDFDAHYQDVAVRVSDGALVSGRASFDLDAKEKADDGSETVKTQLKVKTVVVFEDGNEAVIDLDSRYKYRIKLDSGELSYEGRID